MFQHLVIYLIRLLLDILLDQTDCNFRASKAADGFVVQKRRYKEFVALQLGNAWSGFKAHRPILFMLFRNLNGHIL